MSIDKEYTKILDETLDILNDTKDDIKFDLGDLLKPFRDTSHFERLEEKFKDFQHYLNEIIDDCKRAIESPVYVGVIGHYSSGKSSLLNAILFPQKAKHLLPMGQRPVTAKCTLLRFTKKSSHRFFQETISGKEKLLDETQYQRMVSGDVPAALEETNFFRLELSSEDLVGGIFKEMASKRIELFDTPGLGGPYWNDQYALQDWIKQFKLLLVCVGVHQISEIEAQNVNPFLRYSMSPIIPVVTFWDEWEKTDLLQGISDERNAQIKVKEELKRHFPSMDNALDRVIFVSTKNYLDGVDLSDSVHDIFTVDWNIDNVRKALSSFVTDNRKILESQKAEDSPLDKGKKELVLSQGKHLISKFNNLKNDLAETMDELRPKDEYEETLYNACEKTRDSIDREFDRVIDRIEQTINDGISTISITESYSLAFNRIKQEIASLVQGQLSGDIKDRLKRQCERDLHRQLFRSIETTPLGEKKQKHLKEEIKEQTDDFLEDLTKIPHGDIFKPPAGVSDMAMNFVASIIAGFKDLLISNAPLAIGMVLVITICPFIFKYLPASLGLSIIAIILFSVFAMFWSRIKAAKEKTVMQVKEKARKQNRTADIKNRINKHKSQEIDVFCNRLKQTIQHDLRPVGVNSQSMFSDLTYLLQRLSKNIRSVEMSCNDIERGIK